MKAESSKIEKETSLGFLVDEARFLRNGFIEKKAKNSSYSLRAFARDLGLSHSYLSQVMNQKRKLSLEQKLRIAQKLGINIFKSASRESQKNEFEMIEHTLEHEKILRHWYHFAIMEMTVTGPLKNSPRAIARRLQVSEIEAKSAIERLLEFGYLECERNQLIRTQVPFIIDTKKTSEWVREYHQSRLLASVEELKFFEPARVEKRHFETLFIPSSPERVKQAKKMVTRFQKKLISFLMSEPKTEVFQLSLQLFSVENQNQKNDLKKGNSP